MINYRLSNSYRIWLPTKNKIIIIRNVIFNENEFSIGNFELFKNELIIINTKALAQYIKDKKLSSAELIWEKECESTVKGHAGRGTRWFRVINSLY
jgi:hypothetical protein